MTIPKHRFVHVKLDFWLALDGEYVGLPPGCAEGVHKFILAGLKAGKFGAGVVGVLPGARLNVGLATPKKLSAAVREALADVDRAGGKA